MSTLAKAVREAISASLPAKLRPSSLVWAEAGRLLGNRIASGPFRGFAYVEQAMFSQLWPKLAGTYEKEVAPQICRLASESDRIVVVGAAEGYYAVGLARLNPTIPVVAFEESAAGRALMGECARRNGIGSSLEVKGHCDDLSLGRALAGSARPFVLVDIDGGETALMDPVAVPSLLRCALVVETHDYLIVNCREQVASRFERSHRIERFPAVARSLADLPVRPSLLLKLLSSFAVRHILSEQRPGEQWWLVMTPRGSESVSAK